MGMLMMLLMMMVLMMMVMVMVARWCTRWCLQIWSFEPPLFRMFYCTGWEETVFNYRRVVNGKPINQASSLCTRSLART